MYKRLLSFFVVLVQMISVISCYAFPDDTGIYVDLEFDNNSVTVEKTGWAIHTPTSTSIDGVSVAKITGSKTGIEYYQFEVKDKNLKGKLTIETRVKVSTANVFYVKAFMNSGASLGYASLMSRFNNPALGGVWVNTDNTSQILDNFTTDIVADEPDMENGWSVIYIDVDTESGTYTTYVNNREKFFEGRVAGSADNYLHSLRFGVSKDTPNDPDQNAYIDYIKVYSSELLDVPEKEERNIEYETNFDDYPVGLNLRKSLFAYVSDNNAVIEVAQDPMNDENKCVKLSSNSPQYAAVSAGVSGATIEFSAYLPNHVSNDLITIYSESSSLVCSTNSSNNILTFGGSGDSGTIERGQWNDYKFDIDLTKTTDNVICYINNEKVTTKTLLGNEIFSFRFGVPNTTDLYIDDFRFYSNNGTAKISASNKGGVVSYGEKVYLTSSIENANIYYTTDGSIPDANSTLYDGNGVFIEENNMSIKAVAIVGGRVGRVYTLGRYILNSVDGIIITKVNFSKTNISADDNVEVNIGILNTLTEREGSIVVGIFADDSLITAKEEKVQLKDGITEVSFSINAPMGYSYNNAVARVFIWDSSDGIKTLSEAYDSKSAGMGSKPNISNQGTTPILTNLSCSLNSTNRVLNISGTVNDAIKNQDILIIARRTDAPQKIVAVLQKYTLDDGTFDVKIPLRSDVEGGYYKVIVGGRGIENPILNQVYYVDDKERADGVNTINNIKSAEIMVNTLVELCQNGILTLDLENDIYKNNKAEVAKIILNSKNKSKFTNIEDISKAFQIATAMITILSPSEIGLTELFAQHRSELEFTQLKDFDIADILIEDNMDMVNRVFEKQFEIIPNNIYSFEENYKKSYGIVKVNIALKSELQYVLETYSHVLGVDIGGDYKQVSSYEVAKALYNKDYTTSEAIAEVFNARVSELKELAKKRPQSNNGGYAGGTGNISRQFSIDLSTDVMEIESESDFLDLDSRHWAFKEITDLRRRKVISGFEDNTFKPNNSVTRAEFVKMIVEAFELESTDDELDFKDVAKKDWYYEAVAAVYNAGIAKGDGQFFNPNNAIRREDMAVIVYNIISKDGSEMIVASNFSDGDKISDYAFEAVNYLAHKGVINGFEDGSFRPNDTLTRAESARVLYIVIDK